MADCGMRPDEVCRIQWQDIDGLEGRVLVQRGKTSKARRHVGLTQRMRDVFAGIKRRNEKRKLGDSPYVFPSPRSKDAHIKWLSAVWARTYARVEAAIGKPLAPGLVPCSARHTYATNYLKGGGDIGRLSLLMGHADIRTTMKYVHMLEASDAARIMDKHNERKLQIVRSA
jgi:integrase